MKTNSLLCLTLLLTGSMLRADVASDLAAGRAALVDKNLQTAVAAFQKAADADPAHEEASTLAGMSIVVALLEDPKVHELLERAGLPTDGLLVYNLGNYDPFLEEDENGYPIMAENLSSAEAQVLLRETVLPRLQQAGNYLARVHSLDFSMRLEAAELNENPAIQIGYPDVLVMRSILQFVSGLGHILVSQNLEVNLAQVFSWEPDTTMGRLLMEYPQLLQPLAPHQMAEARNALLAAIDLYDQASPLLRGRTDEDSLFLLEDGDLPAEARFLLSLHEIESAFQQATDMQQLASLAKWRNPDRTLNLAPLFSGQYNLRSFFPVWYGNTLVTQYMPDATLGGLFPQLTRNSIPKYQGEGLHTSGDLLFSQITYLRQTQAGSLEHDLTTFSLIPHELNDTSFTAALLRTPTGETREFPVNYHSSHQFNFPTVDEAVAAYPTGTYKYQFQRGDEPQSEISFSYDSAPQPVIRFDTATLQRVQSFTPGEPLTVSWEPVVADWPADSFAYLLISAAGNGLDWPENKTYYQSPEYPYIPDEWVLLPVESTSYDLPGWFFTANSQFTVFLKLVIQPVPITAPGLEVSVSTSKETATLLEVTTGAPQAIIGERIVSDGKLRRWSLDAGFPGPAYVESVPPYGVYVHKDTTYVWSNSDILGNSNHPDVHGLLRLQTNGTLDPSFQLDRTMRSIIAMAVDSQNRIYVVSQKSFDSSCTLHRLLDGGSIDSSFAPLAFQFIPRFLGVEPGTDNIIVPQGVPIVGAGGLSPANYRILPDGQLDPAFHPTVLNNGATPTGTPTLVYAPPVFDSQGRILLSGYGYNKKCIWRLLSDGQVDTSFTLDSRIFFRSTLNRLRGLGLQSDGKIVIGGDFMDFDPSVPTNQTRYPLLRLLENGTIDPSFRYDEVATQTYFLYPLTPIRMLQIEPDDKITFCGATFLRLNADGSRDVTFLTPNYEDNFPSRFQFDILSDGSYLVADTNQPTLQHYFSNGQRDGQYKNALHGYAWGSNFAVDSEGIRYAVISSYDLPASLVASLPAWEITGVFSWDRNDHVWPYEVGNWYYGLDWTNSVFYRNSWRFGVIGIGTPWGIYGVQYVSSNTYNLTRTEVKYFDQPIPTKYIQPQLQVVDILGYSYLTANNQETSQLELLQFDFDGLQAGNYPLGEFAIEGYPELPAVYSGLVLPDNSVVVTGYFNRFRNNPVQSWVHLDSLGAIQPGSFLNRLARDSGKLPVIYSAAFDSGHNLWLLGEFDSYDGQTARNLVQITLSGQFVYGNTTPLTIIIPSSNAGNPRVSITPEDEIVLTGLFHVDGEAGYLPLIRFLPQPNDTDGDGFGYPYSYELGNGYGWNPLFGYYYGAFHPFIFSYNAGTWLWLAGGEETTGYYFWHFANNTWGFAQGQWYPYYANLKSGAWELMIAP